MAYRDLGEALEARRRALETESGELDAKVRELECAAERRREVESELRTLRSQTENIGSPRRLPLLQRITVASPCSQSWDAMSGDERRRFCRGCSKYVYNLSAMTADEAEALVYETEGQICARFYRREDGTILTSDCPERRRRNKRRAIAAVGAFGIAVAAGAALTGGRTATMGAIQVQVPSIPKQPAVMGSVAVTPDLPPVPAAKR